MKTCSRCNSKNLIKSGFTSSGRQKYRCKDCGYRSTMNQKVSYIRADYNTLYDLETTEEKNSKNFIGTLSKEDAKIIFIYKFRFNVSEQDIADHIKKPIEVVKSYIEFYTQQQKFIDFGHKEKQLKHWLGIK